MRGCVFATWRHIGASALRLDQKHVVDPIILHDMMFTYDRLSLTMMRLRRCTEKAVRLLNQSPIDYAV